MSEWDTFTFIEPMDVSDVASVTGEKVSTISNWATYGVSIGRIAYKMGRFQRFDPAEVHAYIAASKLGEAAVEEWLTRRAEMQRAAIS